MDLYPCTVCCSVLSYIFVLIRGLALVELTASLASGPMHLPLCYVGMPTAGYEPASVATA